MVIRWLLPLLLIGAPEKSKPEEGVQRLRIAWASQYEWKEDDVKNANCEFRFRYVRGSGTTEQVFEGTGEFLADDVRAVIQATGIVACASLICRAIARRVALRRTRSPSPGGGVAGG